MLRRSGWLRSKRKKAGVTGRAAALPTEYRNLIRDLKERCSGQCENPWCRTRTSLDPHHIIKRSQGGPDTAENIAMLCRHCHDHTDLAHSSVRWLGVEAKGREVFVYSVWRPDLTGDVVATTYLIRYTRPGQPPMVKGGIG